MGQVSVIVNGRTYGVACDDGQEERIRRLAQYIDGKVADFAKSLGQIGDARLILLAGLVVADELAEANEALLRLRRSTPAAASQSTHDVAADAVIAAGIESLAVRIEAIAEELERVHM
ncbi:MAG TPA: cell division protein ZapA [Stellaceae bacterium]|jgi:cell division protein ZapA